MKTNKKTLTWLFIIALLAVLGFQQNIDDNRKKEVQAIEDLALSKEIQASSQSNLYRIKHNLYLNSICEFKNKVQPINEILENISARKSIPPDLLPELQVFNESAKYLSSDDSFYLSSDMVLNPDEVSIDLAVKNFSKEINLKTAELEQGIISASDSYFSGLDKRVNLLVRPACELYYSLNPDKKISSSPSPDVTRPISPNSISAELEKIGRQVSYDAICKLESSAQLLISEIENALTSIAYKSALLEVSKNSIYDLGFAAFSFNGKGLYKPLPTELHWATDSERLKVSLEEFRYSYWSKNSEATLNSMLKSAKNMKMFGNSGCIEVNRLKGR